MELSALVPIFCRSGVEPPTGTIHPRESRGTAHGKHESIKRFTSGGGHFPALELRANIWQGWSFPTLCRSFAGRGLNPRPERSTHAKAGEQRTENMNQLKDSLRGRTFSGFGITGEHLAGMELSDLVPVFCRSGVEPPTGTIHPRESRGTAHGKHESIKRFTSGGTFSGFGIADGHLAGMELSDLVPVWGSTLDRLSPMRNAAWKQHN